MKNSFLIIFLCILLGSCKEQKEESEEITSTSVQKNPGIDVSIMVVGPEVFQKQITSNGIVRAQNRSELRFKTTEQIENINVKNGQKVTKGTLLANLDNDLLKNELEKAKINFKNAEHLLVSEKIKFGLNGVANTEIKSKVLHTLLKNSGYRTAKNQVENAQLLYNQTMLRAPFSGTVANLKVKEGNYVTGADVFCTLLSQQKVDVIFHILENELPFMEMGQAVEIIPFAVNNILNHGEIIEINPIISEEGLVRIKAEIVEPGNKIFDGMNVKVLINKPLKNKVVVPKEALVLRSNREVIFSLKNGVAKWNYVKIAAENTTQYAIEEGITVGDTIIVSGNLNLVQNSEVNPSPVTKKGN